jgi:hypothetical protein
MSKIEHKMYNFVCGFYGCETWSLTLREGHRLKVFLNMVLRRIFGPSRDEIGGGQRKLHGEELNNLYSSQNNMNDQVKEYDMGRACSMIWAKRNAYRILVVKPGGKGLL